MSNGAKNQVNLVQRTVIDQSDQITEKIKSVTIVESQDILQEIAEAEKDQEVGQEGEGITITVVQEEEEIPQVEGIEVETIEEIIQDQDQFRMTKTEGDIRNKKTMAEVEEKILDLDQMILGLEEIEQMQETERDQIVQREVRIIMMERETTILRLLLKEIPLILRTLRLKNEIINNFKKLKH